jgi:NTE family protein
MPRQQVSLVLSGGIALGAYEAGAYAAMHEHEALHPQHLAGSSIGAITSALIAGNTPERRVNQLRAFWDAVATEAAPFQAPWLDAHRGGSWRHAHNWLSVLQTRLFGRSGAFRLRVPELISGRVTSFYDLTPLTTTLERLIDFDRLNRGTPRVTVVITDIASGEAAVFDTARGDRLGPAHLLATCGFLPDFAPVEIQGRLLGDGGLVANAPIENVLLDTPGEDLLCFVVDLFSPEGDCPTTLEEAASGRWDLMFGNQSRQRLRTLEREFRLRWALARIARDLSSEAVQDPALLPIIAEASEQRATLLYLSYRAPKHEAGPEKPFDFSQASIEDRWEAGYLDMAEAIRLATEEGRPVSGIAVREVRR